MYIGTLPLVSNRATFEQSFQAIDADDGSAFDLTAATITFEIRDPVSQSAILSATNNDGVDVVDADDGIFTVTFTATQMSDLDAKEYEVGCTITVGDFTTQYIAARQPVIDGVVAR
jgi:hypothetical protein